jgi:hypothetical protein
LDLRAVYAFKEVLNVYVSHGRNVLVCFIDASKVFDRVDHWTLYSKLIERCVSIFIVRILKSWYSSQLFCVRWGKSTYACFHVTNAFRGVMSPRLVHVYIDDINKLLSESCVGCNIGGAFL